VRKLNVKRQPASTPPQPLPLGTGSLYPASNIAISAPTRFGVTFGPLPQEITLMNSIQACSFALNWSHGPTGTIGSVNTERPPENPTVTEATI